VLCLPCTNHSNFCSRFHPIPLEPARSAISHPDTALCTSTFHERTDAARKFWGAHAPLRAGDGRPRHRELFSFRSIAARRRNNSEARAAPQNPCKIILLLNASRRFQSAPLEAAMRAYRDCTPPMRDKADRSLTQFFVVGEDPSSNFRAPRPAEPITPVLMISSATFVAVPFQARGAGNDFWAGQKIDHKVPISGEAAVPAADVVCRRHACRYR